MIKKVILPTTFLLFSLCILGQTSNNLENDEHLLDGTSFTYQYQSASAISIAFKEGELTYQWIVGKNAGKPAKTYPYKSRKLDHGVYLVNWHEPKLKNFITLVYNLNSNTCASSVIVHYGDETPILAFEGGIIEHVKQK